MLNNQQLKSILPKAKNEDIEFYLDALISETAKYEIDTPIRLAHFIAQIAHESGSFHYKVENLNYSAKALLSVFGKYFQNYVIAQEYARKPECIANKVYADRMDNGGIESGDGWRYRGRGLIQLTGCENYTKCGIAIDQPLKDNPDLVASDPAIAVAAACWYWQKHNLNELADNDDIKTITKRINGGLNGLQDRNEYLIRAKQALSEDGMTTQGEMSQQDKQQLFEDNIQVLSELNIASGSMFKALIMALADSCDTYIRLSDAVDDGHQVTYSHIAGDASVVVEIATALGLIVSDKLLVSRHG